MSALSQHFQQKTPWRRRFPHYLRSSIYDSYILNVDCMTDNIRVSSTEFCMLLFQNLRFQTNIILVYTGYRTPLKVSAMF